MVEKLLRDKRTLGNKVNDQALKVFSLNDNSGVQKTKNALIIGWSRESASLYDKIKDFPALGYNIKGFISVGDKKSKLFYRDVPLLGKLSNLTEWASYHSIDEVLIALEPELHDYLGTIVDLCTKNRLRYRIVTDTHDTVYGHVIQDIYDDLFRPREISFRRLADIGENLFHFVGMSLIFGGLLLFHRLGEKK